MIYQSQKAIGASQNHSPAGAEKPSFARRALAKAYVRFLLLFTPVATVIMVAFAGIYHLEVKNEVGMLLADQTAMVRLEKEHMNQLLADGIADVRIQSQTFDLINMSIRPDKALIKKIETDFINFLRLKKVYSQARFLNRQGREIIRVDYRDGECLVSPEERLQDKADRYYFKEAMRLDDGQVFVSPFDLNVENGRIEKPLNPTIRLATPLTDKDGNKWGIVVLNYMGNVLLDGLRDRLRGTGAAMLVDEEGWWLLGPKPEDEWGFMFPGRESRRFMADFPDGWEYIQKRPAGYTFARRGLLTFETVSAPGTGTSPPIWYIISYIPAERVDDLLGIYLHQLTWLAAGLLTGLAVLVFFLVRAHSIRLHDRQVLAENESRLRAILETADDGIVTLDQGGVIRSTNPAAERIFGYASDEVVGRSVEMILHPSVRESARLVINRLTERGRKDFGATRETLGLRKDGKSFPLNVSVGIVVLKSGPLIIGVARDISRRKEAEARIAKNSENQEVLKKLMGLALLGGSLDGALQAALEIIYSTSWIQALPKGGFFLVESDQGEAYLRLRVHRGLGERLVDVCGKVPLGRCHCGRAASTSEIQFSSHLDGPHENLCEGMPDLGHYCVPIVSGNRTLGVLLLYVPEGHQSSPDELVFLDSVARTMSALIERHTALQAIADSEARLQAVLETAVEGIVTIDSQGMVESANPAVQTVFGYKPEEMIGRKINLIQPEPIRSHHDEYIRRYLDTSESKIIGIGREVEGVKKDGTRFPLYLSVSEVKQGGRVTFTGILRDITKLKEYEDALFSAKEQAEKANRELMDKQRLLDEDLKAAAGIQQALLPSKLPHLDQVKLAWRFMPSLSIGGDLFGVDMLDDEHICLYMLDVAGHGVPAALLTVSVNEQLDPKSGHVVKTNPDGSSSVTPPSKVIDFLEGEYPLERFDKSFTINYMTLNLKNGELRYCSAGHPPPLLLRADGTLERLEKGGTIIGLGGVLPFEEGRLTLEPGDKMLLYTDGVLEYENQEKAFFGEEKLEDALIENRGESIDGMLNRLWETLQEFGQDKAPSDDVSMLGLEYIGKSPNSD